MHEDAMPYNIYVQVHTPPQHQRRVMQNLSVCHEGQKQGLVANYGPRDPLPNGQNDPLPTRYYLHV